MSETQKPKLVGVNHIALEVGNIDEALAFYGRIFDSSCAGEGKASPSSTWATNSSRSWKDALSQRTIRGISGSLWTIAPPCPLSHGLRAPR